MRRFRVTLLYVVCYILFIGCIHKNGSVKPSEPYQQAAPSVKQELGKSVEMIEGYPFCDSVSNVFSYRQRMTLKRIKSVPVIYPDVYKIETQQTVYSPNTKEIVLNVINVDAVQAADLGEYSLEQWDAAEWISFPFIDNLTFAGVGRSLSKGDTISETIYMREFKEPLKPNKYKARFYVFLNMLTSFSLTENDIKGIIHAQQTNAPWDFRVLDSASDSIRMVFRNFTNLEIQPIFFPSVEDAGTGYSVHPLARSGWSGEAEWMRKYALLKEGEAIFISIPTSWDIHKIDDPNIREQYNTGKLAAGNYNLGFQFLVYMNTEFEVK